VLVEEGAEVAEGDALLVLEAMKMEHTVRDAGPGPRIWSLACCDLHHCQTLRAGSEHCGRACW